MRTLLASLLLAFALCDAALFSRNSAVVEARAARFTEEVLYHPHVAAVMFYSPYCGHCQRMAPDWEAAAQTLKGVAKFVAVDCTLDKNQYLCKKYGVKGYPSLQVFQPAPLNATDRAAAHNGSSVPRKRPARFNYNSRRDKDALVSFVRAKVPDYTVALNSSSAAAALADAGAPKLVLLQGPDASKVVPLPVKALSRDFFGRVDFYVLRSDTAALWPELGFRKQKDAQLVYVGADGARKAYKGKLDHARLHKFVQAQLDAADAGQNKQDL